MFWLIWFVFLGKMLLNYLMMIEIIVCFLNLLRYWKFCGARTFWKISRARRFATMNYCWLFGCMVCIFMVDSWFCLCCFLFLLVFLFLLLFMLLVDLILKSGGIISISISIIRIWTTRILFNIWNWVVVVFMVGICCYISCLILWGIWL